MACGEQVGHCELVWSDAAGKVAAGGGDARLRVGGDWRRRWGGVAIDEVEIERYDADDRDDGAFVARIEIAPPPRINKALT